MRKYREENLQRDIIMWFNQKFRPEEGIIIPVVNEAVYNNKNLLVLKGTSDLIVVFPDKVFFVECKIGRNGQSKNQKIFERRVSAIGYQYDLCYSLEQFKQIIGYENI